MISNNSTNNKFSSQVKTGAQSKDLDMIANFMDNILKSMKQHIENADKKQINTKNQSINSDSFNKHKKVQISPKLVMIPDEQQQQQHAATNQNAKKNLKPVVATKSGNKPTIKSASFTNTNRPKIITHSLNQSNRPKSESKHYNQKRDDNNNNNSQQRTSRSRSNNRSDNNIKNQKVRSRNSSKSQTPPRSFDRNKLKTNVIVVNTKKMQQFPIRKSIENKQPTRKSFTNVNTVKKITTLNDKKQNKSINFLRPVLPILNQRYQTNQKKINNEIFKKPNFQNYNQQKVVKNIDAKKLFASNVKPLQNIVKNVIGKSQTKILTPSVNNSVKEEIKMIKIAESIQNESVKKPEIIQSINKTKKEEDNMKTVSILLKPITKQQQPSVRNSAVPMKPTTSQNTVKSSKSLQIKQSVLSPMEIIQDFVNLVNKAKRDRKTFTVCGNFFSLRRAFAERGWIEKVRVNVMEDKENWKKIENLSNFELVEGIRNKELGEKYRRAFISKLLAGHQVDFYWDYMTNPFSVNNDRVKRTVINRYPFGATRSYTTKAGLCNSLKEAHWYYIQGYSNILFPRTYNLANEEDTKCFIDDFRLSAAVSLLKWITQNTTNTSRIMSADGKIPTSVFNFATIQVQNFIKQREHRDIDKTIPIAKDYEWNVFLEKFYYIMHQEQRFKETIHITIDLMIDQARYFLNKVRKYLPDLNTDGVMNLWLLKPHNGSRGCGILLCRTLKYILDTVEAKKELKYVVQKYIERPLLIHNTKFDIRQWFLVCNIPYLTVWIYKECYMRFSSQTFNLNKLHESIHLTNNSIQCRYKNCQRNSELPDQNMWHSDTFRKYLDDIGQPYTWRNIIYKGMKESLIGLFMLCQDKLITRNNSFELCGADFMLTEDYKPYLIEINSRPALYPSTKITGKMCPQVLEDVIKVVVDFARNPKASTGKFELIYKDTLNNTVNNKSSNSLIVEGISYFSKYAKPNENQTSGGGEDDEEQKQKQRKSYNNSMLTESTKYVNQQTKNSIQKILNIEPNKVKKDVKNTLEKILSVIHSEQDKRDSDNENHQQRHTNFRNMLSEFVEIISDVKNEIQIN